MKTPPPTPSQVCCLPARHMSGPGAAAAAFVLPAPTAKQSCSSCLPSALQGGAWAR